MSSPKDEKSEYISTLKQKLKLSANEQKLIFNDATDENNLIPPEFKCFICQSLVFQPYLCDQC